MSVFCSKQNVFFLLDSTFSANSPTDIGLYKLVSFSLYTSQSQAASQEALDQIRAANESNVRSQLEQKIRELEAALLQTRTTQQESLIQRDSTRTELDRYRELYSEELRLRKSLSAKLDR